MVIQAAHLFQCKHEFVLLASDHLVCHKCEHSREELPGAKWMRKALLFFPIPQIAVAS